MSDGGKGSAPRPYSVDRNTFADNWDLIFGKKNSIPREFFENDNGDGEMDKLSRNNAETQESIRIDNGNK